jgi:hypothetical protein
MACDIKLLPFIDKPQFLEWVSTSRTDPPSLLFISNINGADIKKHNKIGHDLHAHMKKHHVDVHRSQVFVLPYLDEENKDLAQHYTHHLQEMLF